MLQFLTTKRLLVATAIVCVSSLGSIANAQQPAPAATTPAAPAAAAAPAAPAFVDLMAKVRAERTVEQNIAKEREARFKSEMEKQRALNTKAQADRTAAEARTNRLDAQFAANEISISELEDLLATNQGNLGELFGVTRQIAGDTLGDLTASLVNTQLAATGPTEQENRLQFMSRMATAAALPNIVDLERMWMEMLGEMKTDGEVVHYTTPVIQNDGTTRVDTDVVRVGSFSTYGDGNYLVYLQSQSALAVLGRQPVDADIVDTAENIISNTSGSGYTRAIVDPTRGALLSLYVERPNWFERINNGEAVPYVIVGVGLLGVVLALFQYGYLIMAKMGVAAQLKNMSRPNKNNALGRLLLTVKGADGHASDNDSPEVVELRISEAVLREIPKLERFQSFLRLAVAAGPLLGLIGTVIGMILTFQSITASGSSDPKLMADGIGQAMIATVLGLGIAIPLLFINAGLVSLSKSVVHVLEEESTSMLATRLKAEH